MKFKGLWWLWNGWPRDRNEYEGVCFDLRRKEGINE